MSTLELHGVHAGYGKAQVLHDVSLRVGDGSITTLLGANGAGKTTTLRAVSGLVRFTGQILLDGRQVPAAPDAVARLGVAHVPQGRGTIGRLSVDDNLHAGALLRRDRAQVRADLRRLRELFPVLAERARSQAAGLSGGEQQMLAIARALMGRPSLLLLDEPSLGLAPLVTKEVFVLLPRLRDEWALTVLVVEQNADLALRVADHAVVLESGRVALAGTAAEIAGHDEIRRAYLGN
ncbi:ABC transporter ATP-binding protein [Planotetraspora thailandica]|uniref:ABC transporter ATP-binding protein n=1 Tax=Planotetraspora thailandica TaxID=487172 RepID=A0A8J3Y0Q8_9ACTN|nr:ABC transporter ATP-binding protein [Planotetraspora thailandica]GII58700.1 ABC transporter ATP-binding protein [Planotetraspora thailandica]